jgi:thiol-disulfide isomerase/thioredoxin
MKLFYYLVFAQMAVAAPDMKSANALKTDFKDNIFSASLAEGYHFNEKAPNGIQINDKFIKPTAFFPQNLKIEKLPPDAIKGTAHIYVCDDKITFCEMHTITLGKPNGSEKTIGITQKSSRKFDSLGFTHDFEFALSKAKKQNKLVLVDFGARWCPSCIRLEHEVFEKKSFKEQTKPYVKVKVDVDFFSSNVLQEKFAIRGYPTTLFLTSEGQEIARFYDYQSLDFVNGVLAEIKKYPLSIESFEKMELNEDMKLSLAKRYFYSDQNTKAIALMEKMEPQPKEYWYAKIGEAAAATKKDPSQKKKQIEVLNTAISSDPESTRSIAWRNSLVEVLDEKSEEARKVAKESDQLTDKLLSNEEALKKAAANDLLGEYTGLDGFYVAIMNAQTADSADYEAKRAWGKVLSQGERYHVDAKTPGISLRLLSAMMQVESYDKALGLVNGLLKENPRDGDLQRRKMRVLIELKKYPEAIRIGQQALKNSYGLNEFFVVEPLAKAYMSLNKKAQAKKLLKQYLSRNEINFSDLVGIKSKLEKLNKEI